MIESDYMGPHLNLKGVGPVFLRLFSGTADCHLLGYIAVTERAEMMLMREKYGKSE